MALADMRHVGNRQADTSQIEADLRPEVAMGNTKIQSPIIKSDTSVPSVPIYDQSRLTNSIV